MANYCLVALVIGLLASHLYFDLRYRRLPNRLVALYAMLWPLAFAVSGIPGQTWLQHGIVALSGFAVLLMLFVLGGMGGGDVKLGTAVFAWAGWHSLLPCLFVIGVAGLVLALLGLLADWLAAKATNQSQCRKRRMWHAALYALSANRGVPYGVALAMGGLVALPAYW